MSDSYILSHEFCTQVINLLEPYVTTLDDRETILTEAFYFSDSRAYNLIKREGHPRGFAVQCVRVLRDYCLTDEVHALERLLDTLRNYCGMEQNQQIDNLMPEVQLRCKDTKPIVEIVSSPVTLPPLDISIPAGKRIPTLFISYSHKDDEFAQQLIQDLQKAGHACWIDTIKIKGGDEWIKSITEGINNSYAFISIVSKEANASTWVRREFLWAEYKKKPIFPVKAKACELTIYLMERQVTMMHEDYATGLQTLLDSLPAPYLPITEQPAEEVEKERREAVHILRESEADTDNRRRLELDYLDTLRAEVLFDLEKYTPLGGESHLIVEVRQGKPLQLAVMPQEFVCLPGGEIDRHEETRRFDNAVKEILDIKRAVVLGEPGGGKTTTLLGLAGQLADEALKNPAAPLPIFIRLGRWTKAEQPLAEFIAGEMGKAGKHFQTLCSEGRAVLLLDGMNEIPVAQRKAKYPQIERFIKQYPDWLAVASCREQDYTVDLGLDKITITPLDPLRIREFVNRYLKEISPEAGEKLFWRIVGRDTQRFERRFEERFADTVDNWQQVFWLNSALPEGIEWKNEFIDTRYYSWELWLKARDHTGSLLQLARNPYMLAMLTQIYADRGDLPDNRGQLFADFVNTLLVREHVVERDERTHEVMMTPEAESLLAGIAALAYEMQVQRGQSDNGNAVTVLPLATVKTFLNERQLYLAGSTSILDVSEDEARFSHQLLQEYFAAVKMREGVFAAENPLKASDIWKPGQWWQRTNWEEAVILLAGLFSDDSTAVIEWVAEANPEVAAMCITRSGASLPDEALKKLSADWQPRLDPAHEPEIPARASVGRALGLVDIDTKRNNRQRPYLDTRKGVGLREDGLPDMDWVEIPEGKFQYGGDKDAYRSADAQELYLPTFYIARYPVTYLQFQAFVDAEDGFYNPQWWEGLAADADYRKAPGDQAFKYGNHPRERVSWYDAVAFCRWLSHRYMALMSDPTPDPSPSIGRGEFDMMDPLTWPVRLATEQEWEKAARGTGGRKYPYGDNFDAQKGNTSETRLKQTSVVGMFLNGASPYGVMDMSGNVWEWTLTEYNSGKSNNIVNRTEVRVLRGGREPYSGPRSRRVPRPR